MSLKWFKAAGIRALKTFAQTCVAMIPIGISIEQVSWLNILGTAALAAVVSMLTSIAGLPEVENDELLDHIDSLYNNIESRGDNDDKED